MSSQLADGWRIVEKAAELAGQGIEFAMVTVVWRQAPSSGHVGERAIITSDGQIHGWIGGACAEPVVIREAQRVVENRQPRLILLGAPEHFGEMPEGMMFVQMACQSEGALQLYIEPVLPSPHLVVVGRSPMVATLVELANVLGWNARRAEVAELKEAAITSASVVVVATQGHGDEEALEQVLAFGPAFVGLVASRRRGESVLGYLADRGTPQTDLDRVRAPVGLDLGSTSHSEIAVSVLAELVELRAKGALEPRIAKKVAVPVVDQPTSASVTAVDLVCGMTVPADATSRPYEYVGVTYYFCSPGCRASFEKNPAAYIREGSNAD